MAMQTWQFEQAKNRFGELVDMALTQGPQLVTRHGEEAVVIIAVREYRRLSGVGPSLRSTLLNAPRGEPLSIDRSAG